MLWISSNPFAIDKEFNIVFKASEKKKKNKAGPEIFEGLFLLNTSITNTIPASVQSGKQISVRITTEKKIN